MSLILAIAPVYSYALLPVAVHIGTAIAGSKAGKVAIANGTGAVIKTMSPTAKQGLIKNAIALCKANVLAMKACSDILGDMLDDDVHIENKTTVNNDIDVEIYKKRRQDGCEVEHRYRVYNSGINMDRVAYSVSQARSIANGVVSAYVSKSGNSVGELSGDDRTASMLKRFDEFVATTKFTSEQPYKSYNLNEERLRYLDTKGVDRGYVPYSFIIEYRVNCWKVDDKEYLDDNEIAKYFKGDSDDVVNIYNYDYSKHDNITINNKTESGDTINNYKNDFDKTEKEKNVSANATDKMKKKRKGYDVDDINDENCDKNEKGEYDKCGDDRAKKDGEDSESEEEPKKDDEEKKDDDKKEDDEEDKPIDCKASSFHKKVCDWIDWTQEEHEPKQNTKVDIDEPDLPNIDEDRIKFKAVCPPPKPIHLNVVGRDYHTELSYQPLCDFFSELKPFVVGLGWFSGAMIIAGRRY